MSLSDLSTNSKPGDLPCATCDCTKRYITCRCCGANLSAILELAQGIDTTFVWIRTTPVVDEVHNRGTRAFLRHRSDVDAYNAAADAIMASAGVRIIDLGTFTDHLGAEAFRDHAHFVERVCELQAAFIAGHLLAWLRPPR